MKRLSYITICLILIGLVFGHAQNAANQGVVVVENGLFVFGNGKIPKNGYYLFERKGASDKKYKEIAKITVPTSVAEVEQRANVAASQFKHLIPLQQKDSKRVFNYLQTNETDDSLYRSDHLPIIAITAGTAFLDTAVEKDKTYRYRITLVRNGKEIFKKELKPIKNTVKTNLPKPKIFSKDIVNQAVFLEWVADQQKGLTLFNVYRAFFGTKDFKKIITKNGYANDKNGLHLIALDTTAEKSSLYKYYIQPVDLYGNAGEISEIITAGKLQAENLVPISSLNVVELEDYKIKLSWKLHKSAIASNIQIWRSDNYDDGYEQITNLPPDTSEYIDHIPQASENYYYYLKINGGTHQEFKSAKIAAMIKNNSNKLPPAKNVEGKPIKEGVEVSWDYDEPYTNGFYVYRSTASAEKFYQISNLIPVNEKRTYTFKDIDKNLKAGAMYRYTLRAENDAYTLGKFSDTIHVISGKKPALESPQQLKTIWRDGVVELYWKDMSETSEYLLGYKVYRKSDPNSSFQLMPNDTLKSYKNYFNDKEVSAGKNYTYKVTAIDLYGSESAASISSTINIPKKNINMNKPSKPTVYKSSNGVVISWNQIASEDIQSIKIYRSEANGWAKIIKTVSINDERYTDTSVKKDSLYYYKISFITKEGKESNTSRETSVYY